MKSILIWFSLVTCGIFCNAQNVDISQENIYDGEPYISVNPNNGQHIVASWMGFKLGQAVIIKTKVSFDGGNTWSAVNETIHNEIDNTSADPSLQFDNSGNVYLCYIDFDNVNFTNGTVNVVKSSDGGLTWGAPAEAISIVDCPNKLCVDRPWMAVDNSGGPNDGTIYVTGMSADQLALISPPYHSYLAVSTDGGTSFSTPRFADTVNYSVGDLVHQAMGTPVVTTDGAFHMAYPAYNPSENVFARYLLASSTTAGLDLSHQVIEAGTVNQSNANLKKGFVLKASKTNPLQMAIFHVRNIEGDADIYMSETLDGGATWSALLRINSDTPNNGILQDLVWADFDTDGDLIVTWRDRRNGGQGFEQPSEIYASIRPLGGSFGQEFSLSSAVIPFDTLSYVKGNDFMSVQFQNDTIHTVWGDQRSGNLRIYYATLAQDDFNVSISEITSKEDQLVVYPNPSSGKIQVNISEEFEYRILDAVGKEYSNGKALSAELIDISNLKTGNYSLIIELNGEVEVISFIKE